MRSKLNYLIKVSLNRKIKTKWFLIANIIVFIAIVALTNVDHIIKLFGGDFDEKQKIYVLDDTNRTYDLFNEQLKSSSILSNSEDKYEVILYNKTYEDAKKEVNEKDIYIKFDDDLDNTLKITILTHEYMDMLDLQELTTALNNTKTSLAIMDSNISVEELQKIYSPVSIVREYIDDSKNASNEQLESIATGMFAIIILPIFMLILMLVQMIGVEINDEKTTRGMEIIISNVSPVTHFSAKVIAGNLFVLIQGGILLLAGTVGLFVRRMISNDSFKEITNLVSSTMSQLSGTSFMSKLIYIIPLTLLLLILTFVAYSLLAGILASMTTNMEDYQQLQTPIIIISLIGYYLSMMATLFDGAVFLKIVSVIPLISAILAPSLLMLGQIGIVEIIIALVLLIALIYVLVRYGLKIYKVGILNYSSSGLWKKMFKALKE